MKLRPATAEDIDFILTQEAREDFKTFINRSSQAEHLTQIQNPDKGYWIIENHHNETLGYAILSGLTSPHRCICLERFVIAQPGQGQGKIALKLIIQKVFEDYKAHRLWLDVFEGNHRAQHVYKSLGFQPEGCLREVHKREGYYESLLLFSILEQEYRGG